MFEIKRLFESKILDYVEILKERYLWLIDKEIKMWEYKNVELNGLYRRYENPSFFGAYENDNCVGGFILLEIDDHYWPNNMRDKAYYVHKFVVGPKYGGMGYSDKMLEWINNYGKQNNKGYLRLDYNKNIEYLRKMYIRNGYKEIREITNRENIKMILAEIRLD
jgi:ribosomal protein S18 acetylase RimI-like enzyme